MRFFLILALTSFTAAPAKTLRSEIDNFSPNEIVESSVKLPDGTVIKFRRGSSYSQGHKDTILVASWKVNGEQNCCEQELFWEKTDGSDNHPIFTSKVIAWRVFYSDINKGVSNRPPRVFCWKLHKNRKILVAQTARLLSIPRPCR